MRRERELTGSATGARWAVATLDHMAGLAGWACVPEAGPATGGWRRLYLREGEPTALSAVGPESGEWLSVGIELPAPRGLLATRVADLARALAPYEVAMDPDAGADRHGHEGVLRLALRLFTEGLHPTVFRDAVANLAEAAAEARRLLGSPASSR